MTADDTLHYRLTSVPDLSESESVAVVLALIQLGELPAPSAAPPAARAIAPTSAAGRRRAAHFHDVWTVEQ